MASTCSDNDDDDYFQKAQFAENLYQRLKSQPRENRYAGDENNFNKNYMQEVDAHDLKAVVELYVHTGNIPLPPDTSHNLTDDWFLQIAEFLDTMFAEHISYESGEIQTLRVVNFGVEYHDEGPNWRNKSYRLHLSKSICQLSHLKNLELWHCEIIPKELEELPSLEELAFSYCFTIEDLFPGEEATEMTDTDDQDMSYLPTELKFVKTLCVQDRNGEDDLSPRLGAWLSRVCLPSLEELKVEARKPGFAPQVFNALANRSFPKVTRLDIKAGYYFFRGDIAPRNWFATLVLEI